MVRVQAGGHEADQEAAQPRRHQDPGGGARPRVQDQLTIKCDML